ncbi:MAG: glucose-6-phosphate isomerase [Lentisphaeria bacterium]|nr:glucose-6-phosphate isomerase [Lentisphaeria bacterium]
MDQATWNDRCSKYTYIDGESAFQINFGGMNFTTEQLEQLSARFGNVHSEMQKIERGEIKNPDENRKVTHFTDRSGYTGSSVFAEVQDFAAGIRSGSITASTGKPFESAIINGIGGSALGPQLLQMAINGPYWNEFPREKRAGNLKIYFLDNTDTAGLADVLEVCDLETTLVVSVSKSGGTQETTNNLIACQDEFKAKGLDFAKHAAAVTMSGSQLDTLARSGNWLRVFEMAESIGGRTSETSIVGHLPAALAGIDFEAFLKGACHMDQLTRVPEMLSNPAYMLCAMWYIAGEGKGNRNMVIVPYSDRLILMSRYLQQLVMESLGKEKDLDGKTVHQGLNVFGNKGGTDAHAFIQQLNDGRDDFFVTFIEVLQDSMKASITPGITMGDYLHGFMTGLSNALRGKNRQVIKMKLSAVNPYNLGMLIALYERAVAAYAELIHINAFHQPGVQAYKLASKGVISLLTDLEEKLPLAAPFTGTAQELCDKLGLADVYEVEGILAKLSANTPRRDLKVNLRRTYTASKGWEYTVSPK